jgi:Family of unknown function (DUF5995)
MTLADILARRPAQSIDDVAGIMTGIVRVLSDEDGLKWFTHLYRQVTFGVRDVIGDGAAFRDNAFLTRLDVVFANLFFDAAAAGQSDPSKAPPAWRPLLQSRHDRGLARLQFALAGMNAHINRDLPVALVTCYEGSGGSPSRLDPRFADFERINGILESVEAAVKADFLTGPLRVLDEAAGQLDDVIAMWNVRAARDAAWTHGEVLWNLRSAALRAAFVDSLDRFTGMAGRGLMVHINAHGAHGAHGSRLDVRI